MRKPIEGAKQEGAKGLLKGLGKGVVGIVTKPATGVIDFASTTLNVVKRYRCLIEKGLVFFYN